MILLLLDLSRFPGWTISAFYNLDHWRLTPRSRFASEIHSDRTMRELKEHEWILTRKYDQMKWSNRVKSDALEVDRLNGLDTEYIRRIFRFAISSRTNSKEHTECTRPMHSSYQTKNYFINIIECESPCTLVTINTFTKLSFLFSQNIHLFIPLNFDWFQFRHYCRTVHYRKFHADFFLLLYRFRHPADKSHPFNRWMAKWEIILKLFNVSCICSTFIVCVNWIRQFNRSMA